MTEVKETETDNKTNLKCLFKFEKIKNFGETIGKITSNHYFTKYNSKVLDIADDLEILTDTEAVCVTNSSNEITGIIIRKNLFDFSAIVISLAIGFVGTGRPVGIGIGTVIAMVCTGRVIAAFNHFAKKKIEEITIV